MRICLLELDNEIKGIELRQAYIESLIQKLEKPELIVLPELSQSSYMGSEAIWKYADKDSQMTSKWAMDMAKKYHTFIAAGYVEKSGEDLYNSYLIAGKDKVYGIVRKSEAESFIFKRGHFPNLIATPFGKVAVAICYDSRRRHFYENIKDESLSLILFPHGSPNDPNAPQKERQATDSMANAYLNAFQVPICYVNSTGKLDLIRGISGKLMEKAKFRLNGLSQIYVSQGIPLQTTISEAICLDVSLEEKTRIKDIRFYGEDIVKGNWLFRRMILKPDIRAGIRFYEKNKKIAFNPIELK